MKRTPPAPVMPPRQALSLAIMALEHCRAEFPDIGPELASAAAHVRSIKATTTKPPARPASNPTAKGDAG